MPACLVAPFGSRPGASTPGMSRSVKTPRPHAFVPAGASPTRLPSAPALRFSSGRWEAPPTLEIHTGQTVFDELLEASGVDAGHPLARGTPGDRLDGRITVRVETKPGPCNCSLGCGNSAFARFRRSLRQIPRLARLYEPFQLHPSIYSKIRISLSLRGRCTMTSRPDPPLLELDYVDRVYGHGPTRVHAVRGGSA